MSPTPTGPRSYSSPSTPSTPATSGPQNRSASSDGRGYRDQLDSTLLVPPHFLPSPDDRNHFDLEAQVPERLPEVAVLRAPGTEHAVFVYAEPGVSTAAFTASSG